MIKIEVVINEHEYTGREDVEDLLANIRYDVKYTDGVGSYSVNLVEWHED